MGWNADETHSFVKLYLNHTCLWNIEDHDYKQKQKRTEAYRDICNKFNALYNVKLSETGVRSKINNLRSTYIQYLRKVRREQRSIESFNANNDLEWMKDIHECFSSINIPRSLYLEGDHDNKHDADIDSGDPAQNVWLHNDTEESDDQKNLNISPTDDECVSLPNVQYGNTRLVHKIPCKRKRKYHTSLGGSSTDQSRDLKEKKTTGVEDEYDIYGKYIASQIRELGLQRAINVKLQIHNIVSAARLDSLND